MKYYLSNILPRIKQFSLDLDRKEVFTEKPWVFIDENENQQKYIFKRNGELLMSLNGQVTIGKWEYLSAAKSLLIDRITDKILLNQDFINEAVMVLKKDGTKDQNLVLANEIILPDLDVVGYLTKLFYEKNSITSTLMKSGETLEIHFFNGFYSQNLVTIEGKPIEDGVIEIVKDGKKFIIKDSKIVNVLIKSTFDTKQGKIIIEHEQGYAPFAGDPVYTEENKFAPDGKYKLGLFNTITVQKGRIVK